MNNARIMITDTTVEIEHLTVNRKELADYLRQKPEEEREAALIRALEIGVFCLERASAAQDTEFVKRQVESLLNQVQVAVGKIPADTQRALLEKIGTSDNQVLAPIKTLVDSAKQVTTDKINEVRDLLQADIDPKNQSSALGKALGSLKDLLDPQRKDSVQGRLEAAVTEVSAADGQIAKVVKAVVAEGISPLRDELDKLAKEIREEEAAQAIVDQTTLKGPVFEEEVAEAAQKWANPIGAEVTHVGGDNKPGDVLVAAGADAVAGDGIQIVIEAKDKQSQVGRKAVNDAIQLAMETRNATHGIYVCRNATGFAKDIGEWAEGACSRGPWLACAFDLLPVALRFVLVQQRLAALRAAQPEVDVASLTSQVTRIRTAVSKIKNINTKVTSVKDAAQYISDQAEELRAEINDALGEIDRALAAKAPPLAVVAA